MENSAKRLFVRANILSRLWDPFLASVWFAQLYLNYMQLSQLCIYLTRETNKQKHKNI